MDDEIGASTGASTVHDWVRRLAEPVGDPGGGAAAGVMLGMSCALTSMVASYTASSAATGADDAAVAAAIGDRADARREHALRLADVDALRSKRFGAAYRERRGTPRDAAVRSAGGEAARSSADLIALATQSFDDLDALADIAPPFLLADVAVATAALRGALVGAQANLLADRRELAEHGALVTADAPDDDATSRIGGFTEDSSRTVVQRLDVLHRRLVKSLQ